MGLVLPSQPPGTVRGITLDLEPTELEGGGGIKIQLCREVHSITQHTLHHPPPPQEKQLSKMHLMLIWELSIVFFFFTRQENGGEIASTKLPNTKSCTRMAQNSSNVDLRCVQSACIILQGKKKRANVLSSKFPNTKSCTRMAQNSSNVHLRFIQCAWITYFTKQAKWGEIVLGFFLIHDYKSCTSSYTHRMAQTVKS